jgi:hypothetical protein
VKTATGYSYALPGGWVHLDVEPDRRAASVRRAVSGRVRREPRLAPHLAQLDRLLLHECTVAATAGATRVSLLAEVRGTAIVTAAVTFVVHPVPAEVAIDRLSLGPAVRRRWIEPAGDRGDDQLLQVVLPWPGRACIGLLTMSSSCRPLWPSLVTTFDACAASFHWTWAH